MPSSLANQYCQEKVHNTLNVRSSSPEVFCKKGVLRNFAEFTGKHLCIILFLIQSQASACNFIQKETHAQVFSCEFYEISKNTFLIEHSRWLLLQCSKYMKYCKKLEDSLFSLFSSSQMFFKLGVRKNLKTSVLESLCNKVADLQAFVKKRI